MYSPRDEHGLTRLQKKFIDAALANPSFRDIRVCQLIGISSRTLQDWRREEPAFNAEWDRRCEEHWASLKLPAQNTMAVLVESGDYKAAEFVLKTQGYNPTQKVEANITTDKININITPDED